MTAHDVGWQAKQNKFIFSRFSQMISEEAKSIVSFQGKREIKEET